MNFALSVSVVLPLCIYICLGIYAGRRGFLNDKAISATNKMVFRCLYPLLMFDNIISAGEALKQIRFTLVLYMAGMLTLCFLILWFVVPRFVKEKPVQATLIQGGFRSNAVLLAIPIAADLCGDSNTGLMAICVAIVVPYMNVLSVILLESKRGGKPSPKTILKGVATNPLVLGAVAGVLFSLTGLELPALLTKPLKSLTAIITPLSLILLGAGLKMKGVRRDIVPLSAISVFKLIASPLIVVLGAIALGFRGEALICVFAYFCAPTAVASYTMAEQMGADGPLAGEIVAFTTLISMVTIFLWILALSGLHLI